MEIEVISQDTESYPNKIVFKLKDSNPAFANTLRRVLLMEIPVLAIDEVIILENTTPLYDEIIAHRLGLLPIKTPVGEFNLREECSCDGHGCTQCEISMTLEKESDLAGEIETVLSGEFIPDDPEVIPVLDKVPILRMTKGQKITVQAIARLGHGKKHAKWQSSIVSYKYDPIINIDNSKQKNWEEIVNSCPPKILELDGKNLKVTNPIDCILCDLCVEKDNNDGKITVETTGKDFIFHVETLGQLTLKDLLLQAFDVIKNKADELQAKAAELMIED
jgi:DNA-directed RNA polymerase subunit D